MLEETHTDNQGTHPVPPPPPRTESQSTLTPSDQDSGLSASSNSLTDVSTRTLQAYCISSYTLILKVFNAAGKAWYNIAQNIMHSG